MLMDKLPISNFFKFNDPEKKYLIDKQKDVDNLKKSGNILKQNASLLSITSQAFQEIAIDQNETLARSQDLMNKIGESMERINNSLNFQNVTFTTLNSEIKIYQSNMFSTLSELKDTEGKIYRIKEQINEFKETRGNIQKDIYGIYNSSLDIAKITANLHSISKHTFLLSLNASIEASKANDYGLGFSVVASEMGKLSDKSKKNLNEIEKFAHNISEHIKTGLQGFDDLYNFLEEIYSWIIELNTMVTALKINIEKQCDYLIKIEESFYNVMEGFNKIIQISNEHNVFLSELRSELKYFIDHTSNINYSSEDLVGISYDINQMAESIQH